MPALMTAERHELVRANWLLSHEASWHLSDRRMANELKRRAAQKVRAAAGAAESSHHEGQIKPIWSRFLASAEDSGDRLARAAFLVLFIVPAIVIWLGPALGFAQIAYGAVTEAQLRKGLVPRRKLWFVAAAVLGAGGGLAAYLLRASAPVATFVFYPTWLIDVHWLTLALVYGWVQLTLGLALTAWQIRRHGWPGVTIRRSAKRPGLPAAPAAPAAPTIAPVLEQPAASAATADAPRPKAPAIPRLPDLTEVPELIRFDDEYGDPPELDDEWLDDTDARTSNTTTRK